MKISAQWVLVLVAIVLSFNACATTFYVDAGNLSPAAPFTNWPTASKDIQSAVDVATDGDLILVTNGLYNTGGRVVNSSHTGGGVGYATPITNRAAINKAVTVCSVNGPAVTVIQGYHYNFVQTNSASATNYNNDLRGVYLTNNATLDGFTVTGGGGTGSGSGVNCESTNCFLTNCVLTGNVCAGSGAAYGGAGVYQGTLNNCVISNNLVPITQWNYAVRGGAFDSVLNNCLIISNSASFGGGAAYCLLNYCQVIGNIAPFYGSTSWGGGTYMCTANYCLIAGNLSTTSGGGDCFGILNYCILSNNVCMLPVVGGIGIGSGGGSYQQPPNGSYIPMLNNCLVISNVVYGNGGGVYTVNNTGILPILTNCTIVGNTATNQGGGVYGGTLKNCIIYGNYCTSVFVATSNVYNAKLTNCWTSDPLFVNPALGNYSLQSNSPCINAGNNAYVSGTNDLDGNHRIVGGTVDIGAYEYQTPASLLSYAWAQQYGLPTDGTADTIDSDGDGMNNWQEWIAGTIPTNAASVLQLSSPSNSLSGMKVTWQSVSGVSYYLQRSTNLAVQPPFSSIVSNLTGHAVSTSYTDTSTTNGGPYFYRVGVQ